MDGRSAGKAYFSGLSTQTFRASPFNMLVDFDVVSQVDHPE
jgi:hypothetical protein